MPEPDPRTHNDPDDDNGIKVDHVPALLGYGTASAIDADTGAPMVVLYLTHSGRPGTNGPEPQITVTFTPETAMRICASLAGYVLPWLEQTGLTASDIAHLLDDDDGPQES